MAITKAIRKYGKEKFIIEKIEDFSTPEEALSNEEKWIIFYNSRDKKIGYNIATGGIASMLGRKHSDETLLKMSNSRKGEKNHNYGKTLSQDTINKISAATSGNKNINYGKPRSNEIKNKISIKNSGINHPNYGKTASQKTKNKMSNKRKGEQNAFSKLTWEIVRSIRLEYSKTDITQKELAIKYGVCKDTILKIINNVYWKE